MRLKQYPFVWGAGVKTPCQDVNLANIFRAVFAAYEKCLLQIYNLAMHFVCIF
jgi:hypothetical protein